jgi:hypothetical protein
MFVEKLPMVKSTKFNGGFALLLLILLIGVVAIGGSAYYFLVKPPTTEHQITKEKPREFKLDTTTSSGNVQTETATIPSSELTQTSVSSTPIPPVISKKDLKINSYGNVDLGGSFTASLRSAWEQNSMIYAEVVLTNNYNSLLGVNINEFILHGEGVITKPTLSQEVGVNPGESKTASLIFKKIPNPPYTLEYDHPENHTVFKLGIIYTE